MHIAYRLYGVLFRVIDCHRRARAHHRHEQFAVALASGRPISRAASADSGLVSYFLCSVPCARSWACPPLNDQARAMTDVESAPSPDGSNTSARCHITRRHALSFRVAFWMLALRHCTAACDVSGLLPCAWASGRSMRSDGETSALDLSVKLPFACGTPDLARQQNVAPERAQKHASS